MRPTRFTRRAGLRAGLAAGLAAPLGPEAAAIAAATGAAQERRPVGAVLGVGAGLLVAERARAGRRTPPSLPVRLVAGATVGLATRAIWSVAPKAPAAVAVRRTWAGLAPAPAGVGVGLVVNADAGPGGFPVDELQRALPHAEIAHPEDAADLPHELERMAAAGVRALGIAGGDGSVNIAAGVALAHGLPLVVVPAGTLNHLARDLGVATIEDVVTAVEGGHAVEIDVARVAGRPFLNTASFGSYVDIVDARQALERRVGKWTALVVALLRVLRHGGAVEVDVDGARRRLWVAFVGNCGYEPTGLAPTWRPRLDDGVLDVRVADASHPFCRTRLVLAALTGRHGRSPVFRTWRATSLRVASGNGSIRLARDGETFDGPATVDIVKRGERLAVYTPRPTSG